MNIFHLKYVSFLLLVLLSNHAQISVGETDLNFIKKRKVYCPMISYRFLDRHINSKQDFDLHNEQDFMRFQLLKNKIARKLSDNCVEKLTLNQLLELSKLIDRPQGREKQILSLQEKYVQYFTPQPQIFQNLLAQVRSELYLQIKAQVQKYHQERKSVEEQTEIAVKGFKLIQEEIHRSTHQTLNFKDKFQQLVINFSNDLTQGIKKMEKNINQKFFNIFSQIKSNSSIADHPYVQKAINLWNWIWPSEQL